ncbi:MAG: hypothetical protein WCD54_02285, partial [Pseudolabrys sp.]
GTPDAQNKASYQPAPVVEGGGMVDVRFGSKADMCGAQADVCFVPIADLRPSSIGDIVRYDLRSHEVVVAR